VVRPPPGARASYPFRTVGVEDDFYACPSSGAVRCWFAGQHQASTERGHFEDARNKRALDGPDESRTQQGEEARASGSTGGPDGHAPLRSGGLPKPKKGTSTPRHSNRMQKYGGSFGGKPVEALLRDHMRKNKSFANEPEFFRVCLELVGASLARNTWKRYNSALRLWNRFRKESGKCFVFLDYETWDTRFLVWGWRVRKIKVNTLKIYLSELKNLGNLATGLETMGRDLARVLERGMSNLGQTEKKSSASVYPLTIADLRKIRKGLTFFSKKLTGQSIWTCCLVAFWGAFRLGELLGNDGTRFEKFSSLLWEDVTLTKDSAKICIKSAKVRGPPGNLSVLFPIPDLDLCPVRALARLKDSEKNLGMGEGGSPVSGKPEVFSSRKKPS
jgi:hypothetical protein